MHSAYRILPFATRIIILVLSFIVLLPTRPAHAQTGRTYTTADGLPSNNIHALAYKEDPLDFPPCNPPECTDQVRGILLSMGADSRQALIRTHRGKISGVH